MKIAFLGTGAADWTTPKALEMENRRFLSSALIDDCLLIDPNGQVLEALKVLNKKKSKIKYIICTHKHSDHYNKETIAVLEKSGAEFVEIKAGDRKALGDYVIRAYSGNHFTCKGTVHFIIEKGGRTLFYGLDGAWLKAAEVKAIQKYKPNLAVLDATIGNKLGDYRIFEHNNLTMVKELAATLKPYVDKFVISHMARTLHDTHEKLVEDMKQYGIDVAVEGMEIEV